MSNTIERVVNAERVEDLIAVFGSFDENIKWIMLFIFSSEKHPLMMKEAQMINTLYSERVDIDLFWDFYYFNHESDSTKIYLVIGN